MCKKYNNRKAISRFGKLSKIFKYYKGKKDKGKCLRSRKQNKY